MFIISQQPHELVANPSGSQSGREAPRWCEEVSSILTSHIFILVTLGAAAFSAVTTGLATYGPTFLQGLGYFHSEQEASFAFSGVVAFAGAVGTPLGGFISDASKKRIRMPIEKKRGIDLVVMMMGVVVGSATLVVAIVVDSKWGFIVFVGVGVTLLFATSTSSTMAVLQSAPPEMKVTCEMAQLTH